MAESPPYPDLDSNTDDDTDGRGSTAGTPRWVKVFGIIALVLVVVVGILLLTGGGSHGPGRHTSSGDSGGQTQSSSAIEVGGHMPPAGRHTP